MTESASPRAARAQRDGIRLRSILAIPPRAMRDEVTSPKRLPRGRGRASLADLAAWAQIDSPRAGTRRAVTSAPERASTTPLRAETRRRSRPGGRDSKNPASYRGLPRALTFPESVRNRYKGWWEPVDESVRAPVPHPFGNVPHRPRKRLSRNSCGQVPRGCPDTVYAFFPSRGEYGRHAHAGQGFLPSRGEHRARS